MYRNIIFIVVALLLTSCGLIPNTYLAAPISGTVIDDETKKPIAGVNVVVYWTLHKGGFGGRVISDILYVEETVTDKKGRYLFKGWGPVNTNNGRLGYESPELLFFKSGYYHQRKGNYKTQMYFGKRGAGEIHVPNAEKTQEGTLYRSLWDGVNVELIKSNYNDVKYADKLGNLSRDMSHIVRYKFSCKDKTFFTWFKYIRKEINELNKRNIRHYLSDPSSRNTVKDCERL